MPSASTVVFATTSEPGSKLPSGSPSLPRPRSPERIPAHDPVVDQQLVGDRLGEDVGALLLRLLGEEARQLRDRDHVVAVVAEVRRHRLQRQRRALGQQVDRVLGHLLVGERPVGGSRSGNSSRIADGFMLAPLRACARRRPCPSRSPPPAPRRASRSAPARRRAGRAAGSRRRGPPGRRRRSRPRPRSARPRDRSARRSARARRTAAGSPAARPLRRRRHPPLSRPSSPSPPRSASAGSCAGRRPRRGRRTRRSARSGPC